MTIFDLAKLPPFSERRVIGVWRMDLPTPTRMHRSIERVGDNFFLVVRVATPEGVRFGGDDGMPLRRVSESEYRGKGPNALTYRISRNGELQDYSPGQNTPDMIGKPTSELWPNDA